MTKPDIPILRKLTGSVKPFTLGLHEFEPRALTPIGDRYLVEELAVQDEVQFNRFIVAMRDPKVDPRDPMADPKAEVRGVLPAVVIAAGNGHLLGIPDHAVPVDYTGEGVQLIERPSASVPMFLHPGDVILLDATFKGRALRVVGRELRICNQMDCLAKLPVRLRWTDDGWQREDS